MGPVLLRAVAYTLIPFAATVTGAAAAAVRVPGRRLTAGVQHLAAGIVFAAVALELVPPVRERGIAVAVVGFSAGIVAMYGLQRLTQRLERDSAQSSRTDARLAGPPSAAAGRPVGLVVATAVDVFIDGLVLGAGFAVASRTGLLLAVALTLELIFLGLSAAGALLTAGVGAPRAILACAGIGALLTAGTALGVVALDGASADLLAVVLGFGAVALMYLVTEELLTEAHGVEETPWATALFFVGFLVYLLMGELVG